MFPIFIWLAPLRNCLTFQWSIFNQRISFHSEWDTYVCTVPECGLCVPMHTCWHVEVSNVALSPVTRLLSLHGPPLLSPLEGSIVHGWIHVYLCLVTVIHTCNTEAQTAQYATGQGSPACMCSPACTGPQCSIQWTLGLSIRPEVKHLQTTDFHCNYLVLQNHLSHQMQIRERKSTLAFSTKYSSLSITRPFITTSCWTRCACLLLVRLLSARDASDDIICCTQMQCVLGWKM